MRSRTAGRTAFILILSAAFRGAAAQGTPQLLIGDVVTRENGVPLGHSMVTVLANERQTFTSDAGTFAFASMDPGKYRLRVTHIGYAPVEVPVEIPASGAPPRMRIELAHLSVQLATVKVIAQNRCTAPGRPNPDVEPDFAAIVGQLRMNAEQYRLLSDSFPFSYRMNQDYYSMRGDSSRTDEHSETAEFRSDLHGWEYKMGDVIERLRDGHTIMHLPTLSDFAGYEFLNNHCFSYGGLDSTRDGVLIRIAFRADVQIRTPDVDGVVYLDAKTYEIRRADLRLTKPPPNSPDATAIQVTTIFGEISPSIDVIKEVRGITSMRHHGWGAIVAMGEDQRMFGLEWIGNNPTHPAVQP